MPFLHTLEIVGGCLEQAEYHTPLTEGIASFPVTSLFCYEFTSFWQAFSFILCSGWELKVNLKMLCFILLAFVTYGWQVLYCAGLYQLSYSDYVSSALLFFLFKSNRDLWWALPEDKLCSFLFVADWQQLFMTCHIF